MPQFIGALIIIGLFCYFAAILILMVGFALPSAAGGYVAAKATLLIHCSIVRERIKHAKVDLAQMVDVGFDGFEVEFTKKPDGISRYASSQAPLALCLFTGISAAVMIMYLLIEMESFEGLTLLDVPIDPLLIILGSCLAASLGVPGVIFLSWPTEHLEEQTKAAVQELLEATNNKISSELAEVSKLEAELTDIARAIGAAFEPDYLNELKTFVKENIRKVLINDLTTSDIVSSIAAKVNSDRTNLQRVVLIYQEAIGLYDQAESAVRRTGSRALLDRLDQLHDGLTSPDLLSLVEGRQWTKFAEIVSLMADEAKVIGTDASRFTASPPPGSQRQRHQTGSRSFVQPTSEAEACSVLGLPANATNEQIKSVYRALAKAWHVDGHTVGDDTRMKQINAAYDFLKRHRKVS